MYDKLIFLPIPSWTTDGVSLCCVLCDGSSTPNCQFYFPTDFQTSSTFRPCQRLRQFSEYCLLLGTIVKYTTETHNISLYLPDCSVYSFSLFALHRRKWHAVQEAFQDTVYGYCLNLWGILMPPLIVIPRAFLTLWEEFGSLGAFSFQIQFSVPSAFRLSKK